MERTQVQIPAAQLDRQRDFEAKLKEMHADRPLRALVDTFGCQQNVADSQYIMGMLRAMGCSFTDDPAQADVVVLNTCAIRDHAEKRVYGNLGALTHTKKANPAQVICLCGCMAQERQAKIQDRISRLGTFNEKLGTVSVPLTRLPARLSQQVLQRAAQVSPLADQF